MGKSLVLWVLKGSLFERSERSLVGGVGFGGGFDDDEKARMWSVDDEQTWWSAGRSRII